ncbi:MAG: DUF2812 domain-containing protein [Clostridia bacterium]|nr:DUF2812 domain-containing protein [Clostridia bacterium]
MTERKIVRKWIWAWDFDKEERWLNQMAAAGWVLDRVGYCKYEFVKGEPDEYTVRLEMHDPDPAYIEFMKETGVEYIGRVMQWIYFRKKIADGPFELFTDTDARIEHLTKIANLLKFVTIINLPIGIINSFNPVMNVGWLNLLCAALTAYGLGRIQGKRDQLEMERELHE